jgi:hypothetical protein
MATLLPTLGQPFALSGYGQSQDPYFSEAQSVNKILQAMRAGRSGAGSPAMMPLGVPQQAPQQPQQEQQQSSMPSYNTIKQFTGSGAAAGNQVGGYTALSPSQTMQAYNAADPSFTLPGFGSGAGAAGQLGGYSLAGAPEGGYGGYAGYASTLPGFAGADAATGAGSSAAGGSAAGGASAGGGLGAFGPAALFAALIGMGKNTEANHPNTPEGDASLAMLGPSAAQIFKDPLGMGLPTLLGVPFITPFTGSQDAKKTKPEWSGLFPLGF